MVSLFDCCLLVVAHGRRHIYLPVYARKVVARIVWRGTLTPICPAALVSTPLHVSHHSVFRCIRSMNHLHVKKKSGTPFMMLRC